jgi:hypothetical protein
VEGHDNAKWLMRRLSDFFVFKTSEPVLDTPNSTECTLRIAHSSELSGSQIERLLAGIKEVKLKLISAHTAPTTKQGQNDDSNRNASQRLIN